MGRRNRPALPAPSSGPPPREHARFGALADLGGLKQALAEQARQREAERLAERRRQERLDREASVFRRAMTDVAPLPPSGRVVPEPAPVHPVARQRQRDEQEALAQSLSDEIDIAQVLMAAIAFNMRRWVAITA